MELFAAFDIGSNALRLLVGGVRSERVLRVCYERAVTRLGEGVFKDGMMAASNMEEAMGVLGSFKDIVSEMGVKGKRAVGTAALREAGNSKEFVERAFGRTGVLIEVISPEEEAGLTAEGALSATGFKGRALIVDPGGGSTEWMLSEGGRILSKGTIPTGVIKLCEKHLRSDPPRESELSSLEADIEGLLEGVKEILGPGLGRDASLIGTAGTSSTIASIDLGLDSYDHERIHMHPVPLLRLAGMRDLLEGLTVKERASIKGLEPRRADLIIPGIRFTIKLMETFGFKTIMVSDCGLPEGVLLKLAAEVGD